MQAEERAAPDSGRRSVWRTVIVGFAVIAVAGAGLTANVGGSRDSVDRVARDLRLPWFDAWRDSDQDGLTDREEVGGWKSSRGELFLTDPENDDTDEDGLIDALEAGPRQTSSDRSAAFVGLSDPTKSDTDDDGLEDGAEFFADTDPRRADSDGDGLRDDLELRFGSDPRSANPDDDPYSDKQEYDRGSDPLAYDLSLAQSAGAFVVGVGAGDWAWGARKIGRLNGRQLQSPEYLIGQIVSGLLAIGDARDLAANIGSMDLLDAVLSLVGIVPVVGDSARVVTTLTAFAAQGDRAARAVAMTLERLPWSRADKAKARSKIFGGARRLPVELRGGPKVHSVYIGVGYVGRTNDFARRKAQHKTAGRSFTPEQIPSATKLRLGEARAIEEACIVLNGLSSDGGSLQNRIHSIDPKLTYYADAVAWGKRFLDKNAAACSLASPR